MEGEELKQQLATSDVGRADAEREVRAIDKLTRVRAIDKLTRVRAFDKLTRVPTYAYSVRALLLRVVPVPYLITSGVTNFQSAGRSIISAH